jgi:hypothetical protein
MATLYVDYENGNDNYGGTSFAPLAQGANGRITSTTFSSAGASFPNDGSLIGQYLSIFNGSIYAVYNITAWLSSTSLTIAAISGGTALADQAVDRQYFVGGRWKTLTTGATTLRTLPGDTIRVKESAAPTNLGQNATWTSSGVSQNAKQVNSSTNTAPISINCTAHGYATGDTVSISGHTVNTNANGTWEIISTGPNTFTLNGSTGNGAGGGAGYAYLRTSSRVLLTTPVTKNIASTGVRSAAWTGTSTNVTTSRISDAKEGELFDRIAINSVFTTGNAAYWATGALDLSSYQQVSFWIKQESGTIGASGSIDLRLCSDTTGTTAINIITIPNLGAIQCWTPITVDLGVNLGSNIQSIALYINTDNGAQTFSFSNIIACKASSAPDSLTLTSLIGKNTTNETFWGIQSINGTRVMLDNGVSFSPANSTLRGYYGTSETVTTWKREAIKLGPLASSGSGLSGFENGINGNPTIYSGGWDRTNMNLQTSETWFDGLNGSGTGLNADNCNWLIFEKFAFTRFNANISASSASWIILDIVSLTNAYYYSVLVNYSNYITLNIGFIVASGSQALTATGGVRIDVTVSGGFLSNAQIAVADNNPLLYLKGSNPSALIANNLAGFSFGQGLISAYISDLVIRDNSGYSFLFPAFGSYYLKNVAYTNTLIDQSYASHITTSQNNDQTIGNHKIFMRGAIISSATDQFHTSSGISWKIQPTNTERSANYPIIFSLAKVACAANSLVTVKAWMRRDNSGLTMRLVCKGNQITGVTNDVKSSVVAVNAWEQLTIAFTPTETGVVEITVEAFGGITYSGWVDDLTITQA